MEVSVSILYLFFNMVWVLQLEAAAEAASRLQDIDAVLATEKALEKWHQQSSRMPVSPRALADADSGEATGGSPPSPTLDMQDTPIRHKVAKESRLPQPLAHGDT